MIELVNTSLPNGLLPGTHGFATVGMTRGTPDAVRTLLEGLSSYVHRAIGQDNRYRTENPVAWHHVAPPHGGHVLSRVAACEFDYTGRTNRLARHWQAEGAEWPAGCNAARVLLANRSWFEASWEGEARWFDGTDAGRMAAGCGGGGRGAPHWVAAYGAQGAEWAAGLARELRRQIAAGTGGRPLVLVTGPAWDPDGTKLLGLFEDLIDELPERDRGKATFSTYAAVLPGWVPCSLRGYLADDPALGALTKGRPWFDAAAGVLHGAEWLPAEGTVVQTSGAGGIRLGHMETRGRGTATGIRGTPVPHARRKKAGAGEKAFFAVVGVALLAVLGALVWMLAGETPKVDEATDEVVEAPSVESGTEAVAEKEVEEPVADVAEQVQDVASEVEEAGPPDVEVGVPSAPPVVPRLVEEGVWRGDKPRPGEPGVWVMYYREESGEWVEETPRTSDIQGLKWIPPKYRWICLWVDGRNGVFWEFKASPTEVARRNDDAVDWRVLCLGPNERVWSEWKAENRGKAFRIYFDLELKCQGKTSTTNILAHGSVRAGVLWASATEAMDRMRREKAEELQRAVNEENRKIEAAREELRNIQKEIGSHEHKWLNLGNPEQGRRIKEEKAQLEAKHERTEEDNARLGEIESWFHDLHRYWKAKKEKKALEQEGNPSPETQGRIDNLDREIQGIEFAHQEPDELLQLRSEEKNKKDEIANLNVELKKHQEDLSKIPSQDAYLKTLKKDSRLAVTASIKRAEEEK